MDYLKLSSGYKTISDYIMFSDLFASTLIYNSGQLYIYVPQWTSVYTCMNTRDLIFTTVPCFDHSKILGNMRNDPSSLMLLTVMKNLRGLGYMLQIYATEDGETKPLWEKIFGQVSVLDPENYGRIDWSRFDGVIANSLAAHYAISSLMQEPFCSVQLIWIIQEDTLANRLLLYEEMEWEHIITYWKNAFKRADVVVFPEFSFPMLYSVLDTGKFFVIPGSPVDVWAAEKYQKSHYKSQLRIKNGFSEDDVVVLVVGSSFFYNELSWDYAVSMHNIGPLLTKYAKKGDAGPSFKFVFLCGNSSSAYNDALKDIAGHLGLHRDSVGHYGLDGDVDEMLLTADIVLYVSSQEEQGFPSLLTRAMTFGVPVIAPDYQIIRKYVVSGEHGIIFSKDKPDELMKAFTLLISKGGLSNLASTIASSGRLLAKNMQASECIAGYMKLLDSVLTLPSDSMLPGLISQLNQGEWEWDLFSEEQDQLSSDMIYLNLKKTTRDTSVVYDIEEHMTSLLGSKIASLNDSDIMLEDFPTELDWNVLSEIDSLEEVEKVELEEIEGRTDKSYGVWEELYRDAKKAEKLKFEANERDEGELERTGQPVCIYEVYNGAGAWPFLHHGSLYRGLSLSTKSRRLRSDDVDAVGRLSILNETYYRDILLEMGGMFSIANRVDNVHKRPWIGFQSWRAAARKVSLSSKAERVLEETVQQKDRGDVIYFWARIDIDGELAKSDHVLTFWSMCDILNAGNCRMAFEDTFRKMYALPSYVEALPPMPEDGGHWSSLHSWVMPTPSFLEFMMFSRMFADSLDSLHMNASTATECMLGSSVSEKQHCYCRLLELLVNVWAYHSARTMIYIDPNSGSLEEQHPVEQRKGFMWTKYFNATVLKSMDEDLAEAADDGDHPYETWLWPRTGEVHWQGIYEREREERYRLKMDKKRKQKEKILERLKFGYKQKTLAG
ncbi:glycosyl transferase, family 1 protein [Tanacetum coccineum]